MPARKKTPAFRFPKEKQDAFLVHIRAGMQRGAAADAAFAPVPADPERRRKVREWILSHPDFEVLVLDAEEEATENVQEALYQAAISGNTAAAVKWLELKGANFPEHRGRPPKPGETPPEDPFADLGNVFPLNRR